jgi:hypothetical protein
VLARRQVLNHAQRKPASTRTEKAVLQEKRNALNHQIGKWRIIQRLYMPGVTALRGGGEDSDTYPVDDKPELSKLWLPSELPESEREGACIRGVVKKEERLRFAQLQDALVELRRARRINRGIYTHFRINVAGTGQRATSRTQTILRNSGNRIERAARRYNACRASLLALDPHGDWTEKYKILTDEDNRGPGREKEDGPTGQGDYSPSWIWMVVANSANASSDPNKRVTEEYEAAMRVEWARTIARAERWEEEFELLSVEMVRTLLFLEWKAVDWEKKGTQHTNTTVDLQHGLQAYARKQAMVYRNLGKTFRSKWVALLDRLHLIFPLPEFTLAPAENPGSTTTPVASTSTINSTRPLSSKSIATPVPPSHVESDNEEDYSDEEVEELQDDYDDDALDLDCM